MKKLLPALLYTALSTLAIPAAADVSAYEALREGDMLKLRFHESPQRGSDVSFETVDGEAISLAAYEGDIVVLNFWATWCAPCRKEMPELAELQEQLGGNGLEVVTVATGRNPVPSMRTFFDEIGVDNLPLHRDPNQALARNMGVLGLPVTLILDGEGQEIARLQGDADWASDSALAIVSALLEDAAGS